MDGWNDGLDVVSPPIELYISCDVHIEPECHLCELLCPPIRLIILRACQFEAYCNTDRLNISRLITNQFVT